MKNKKCLMLILTVLTAAATRVFAGPPVFVYDSDGNGSESVTLSGSQSSDPDGTIIDYQWLVNGTVRANGFGPTVADFQFTYTLGSSTTTLIVRDDVQVSSADVTNVVVLPQGTNRAPVADATVPTPVMADILNIASVTVNASISSDPDGDPIIRYQWTEGTTTYFDGPSASAVLRVPGLGAHTLTLRVYSRDSLNIIQSGTKNFPLTVNPLEIVLAGRSFARTLARNFTALAPSEDFAGITFNPYTRTYFMTDNNTDKLYEIQQNGDLIRTIDISGLKATGIATADAEGLAWMTGSKCAIALHDGSEMAVVNIVSTTTALSRAQAAIYPLSSKPKGFAYDGFDNSFYWVEKDTPKRVSKVQISTASGSLVTVWRKDVDFLPVLDLADVAVSRRLSSNLFLISESSQTVMEVNMTPATPVLVSSCSLAGFDIPKGGGLMFNHNVEMIIVGKNVAGAPETHYSVFTPTTAVPNQKPTARINLP